MSSDQGKLTREFIDDGGDEAGYVIELVFALDSTQSMDGIFEAMKEDCLNMVEAIEEGFREAGKLLNRIRIGIVEFRDLVEDETRNMLTHAFVDVFTSGDNGNNALDTSALDAILRDIRAEGGGDSSESALDALLVAFDFPWYEPNADDTAVKLRRLVILVTDNEPRPLHASSKRPEEAQLEDLEIVQNRYVAMMRTNEARLIVVGPRGGKLEAMRDWQYVSMVELNPEEAAMGRYKVEDFEPVRKLIVVSSTQV